MKIEKVRNHKYEQPKQSSKRKNKDDKSFDKLLKDHITKLNERDDK